MLKWKEDTEKLILQCVDGNNYCVREIQLDMKLTKQAENKKDIILEQINKWYSIKIDKETIENFLYINDYCEFVKE